MKIIKNSFSIIVWILFIVLSAILLSNSAHGMGEYRIAAWEYVQSLFAHSALFWTTGILLLIQVLFINLKPFKYRNEIVACITIVIIIAIIVLMVVLDRHNNNDYSNASNYSHYYCVGHVL